MASSFSSASPRVWGLKRRISSSHDRYAASSSEASQPDIFESAILNISGTKNDWPADTSAARLITRECISEWRESERSSSLLIEEYDRSFSMTRAWASISTMASRRLCGLTDRVPALLEKAWANDAVEAKSLSQSESDE